MEAKLADQSRENQEVINVLTQNFDERLNELEQQVKIKMNVQQQQPQIGQLEVTKMVNNSLKQNELLNQKLNNVDVLQNTITQFTRTMDQHFKDSKVNHSQL